MLTQLAVGAKETNNTLTDVDGKDTEMQIVIHFCTWLRLLRYVAKMAAVKYEKCASIHTSQLDRFEYTIRVL